MFIVITPQLGTRRLQWSFETPRVINIPADKFLPILTEVVGRTASFLKTQVPRLSQLWTNFWRHFEPNPRGITQIPFDASQFEADLGYRLQTLQTLERAIVDGYHVERMIFATIFQKMLSSPDLGNFLSAASLPVFGFKIAETLVASLGQFIALDPTILPARYVIVAKNKAMIRLRGMSDTQILESVAGSKITATLDEIRAVMSQLAQWGLIEVTREGNGVETYRNLQNFTLEGDDEQFYASEVKPVLEWAVQLWRSFYNLRELNTPIAPDRPHASFLDKTVSRAATQGFQSAHFVVANLVKYYEMLQSA